MKKIIFTIILTVGLGLFFTTAQAALLNNEKKLEVGNNVNAVALDSGAGYDTRSLEDVIASIIRLVTSILGLIFVVLIFAAGNNWMQAGGNEEKVKKAKDTIAALLTGLSILLLSYALASGIGGILSKVLLNR
jgi:small-conductance mechanosensitive channel